VSRRDHGCGGSATARVLVLLLSAIFGQIVAAVVLTLVVPVTVGQVSVTASVAITAISVLTCVGLGVRAIRRITDRSFCHPWPP
jgi:hypothetical protein